jgi:hypothetical protein
MMLPSTNGRFPSFPTTILQVLHVSPHAPLRLAGSRVFPAFLLIALGPHMCPVIASRHLAVPSRPVADVAVIHTKGQVYSPTLAQTQPARRDAPISTR